jgi:protein translocase SecG subunit
MPDIKYNKFVMATFTIFMQITLAVLLIGLITIQAKGKGFARGMGGGSASFTRRGLEKLVFKMTFVVSALFIIISILQLI